MVRDQILYPLNMEYKPEKHLSAYERRKINSQKIAKVQFGKDDRHKYVPESKTLEERKHYEYIKRKHQEFEKASEQIWKRDGQNNWTVIDQRKEDELWDE